MQVHMSDSGWHTSTCEGHTDAIWVACESHTNKWLKNEMYAAFGAFRFQF